MGLAKPALARRRLGAYYGGAIDVPTIESERAHVDASSGKSERHRRNRGGDRSATAALWHIVLARMVCDPRTQRYFERRMKEGRTKKEVMRCLKRSAGRSTSSFPPHRPLDSP